MEWLSVQEQLRTLLMDSVGGGRDEGSRGGKEAGRQGEVECASLYCFVISAFPTCHHRAAGTF